MKNKIIIYYIIIAGLVLLIDIVFKIFSDSTKKVLAYISTFIFLIIILTSKKLKKVK